jgi:16S rRNA (cytidine1402-2'-O)-methyltransferase
MLAGAEVETEHSASDIDHLLTMLLEELPLRQAVRLAERISGLRRNLVYQRALELAPGADDPA